MNSPSFESRTNVLVFIVSSLTQLPGWFAAVIDFTSLRENRLLGFENPSLGISFELFPWRDHLRDASQAGVAGVEVVVLVEYPIAGFDELSGPNTHSVADCTQHFAS